MAGATSKHPSGVLKSGLADNPALRWTAVDLRAPLIAACERLDLSPVAAGALGRCLTAGVLLQRMTIKTANKLVLAVSGDGPLSRVLAEVDEDGSIRGTVSDRHVELPRAGSEELGIGRALGSGLLKVWRQGHSSTYESSVEMHDGRIGEAVAHYLEQSEQTRSAVLMGVLAERHGISAAGGIMVEALPGPSDGSLLRFEESIAKLESISRVLANEGLDGLIDAVLSQAGYSHAETRHVTYRCKCSKRSIARFLTDLSDKQRRDLETEAGVIEAQCVFCGEVYAYAAGEVVSPTPGSPS